jgi:predicted exporter
VSETQGVGLEHTWSARNVRPMVAVYVVGVFVGYMALAYLVFHSMDGVKELGMGAIGAVAALMSTILNKWEYRL